MSRDGGSNVSSEWERAVGSVGSVDLVGWAVTSTLLLALSTDCVTNPSSFPAVTAMFTRVTT